MTSLHPPTVVQVLDTSPLGRCGSPQQVFPDSPLSSAPNSPVSPSRRPELDLDDDDLDELNLPSLAAPQPLKRQDSLLGRESRKSRLRASAQARLMHLEEKKSEDADDVVVAPVVIRSSKNIMVLPFEAEGQDPTMMMTAAAAATTARSRSFSSGGGMSPQSSSSISSAKMKQQQASVFVDRSSKVRSTTAGKAEERDEELFPSPADEVDELLAAAAPRRMSPVATAEGMELPSCSNWSPSFDEDRDEIMGPAVNRNVRSYSEDHIVGSTRTTTTSASSTTVRHSFKLSSEENSRHEKSGGGGILRRLRNSQRNSNCISSDGQQKAPRANSSTVRQSEESVEVSLSLDPAPSYDEAVASSSQEIEISYGPNGLQPVLDLAPSYDEDLKQAPTDELGKNRHGGPSSFEEEQEELPAVPTDEKDLSQPFPLLSTMSKEANEDATSTTYLDTLGFDTPLDEMDEIMHVSEKASRNLSSMFEGASEAVVDLTETTISGVEEVLLLDDKSLLDHMSTGDASSKHDDDDDDDGNRAAEEQHRPLLIEPSWSSSDETPLMTNARYTGYNRPKNNSRKNKVYSSNENYWKKHPKSDKQRRRQRGRSSSSRSNKMRAKCEAPSIDPMLPAIVVDPSQLRSIGVKSMMAVCNGIGSLFLAKSETSETPMRRSRTTQLYKKLPPDVQRPHKTTPPRKQILKHSTQKAVSSDRWSNSRIATLSPQQSEQEAEQAAYFPQALQASLEAEVDNDVVIAESHPSVNNKSKKTINKSPAWHVAPSLKTLSKSRSNRGFEGLRSLDVQDTEEIEAGSNDNKNPVTAIKAEPSAVADETNDEDVGGGTDAPSPIAATTEEESWSLAREIQKQASRHSEDKSDSGGSVREKIDAAENISTPPTSADTRDFDVDGPSSLFTKESDALNWTAMTSSPLENLRDPKNKSSAEMSKSDCTAALTPLSEPPPLRRVNVSVEIDDTFGASFSQKVDDDDDVKDKDPPSLNCSTTDTASHLESTTPRSPMSDFLASRMLDTQNADVERPPLIDAVDSDCSSTDDLVSTLDDMVKDLDGLTSSAQLTRAPSFSEAVVVEKSASPITIAPEKRDPVDAEFDGLPILVSSLNNEVGIPKGDAVISLLNNEQRETSSRASRVDEAIWRCRTMRRQCDTRWLKDSLNRNSGDPTEARTSLCVDVDEVRVMNGGIEKIRTTEKSAIEHTKYDDFEDSLALYEDIYRSYELYGEGTRILSTDDGDDGQSYFQRYIAVALHNLGIIHLLRSEPEEALTHFERATQIRSKCLGIGHSDHITSLVKTAVCRFAVEDYSTAYSELREALTLSRDDAVTLSDHRQLAEILNNLGCLSYMGGDVKSALLYFRESLHIQDIVSEHSLYIGSKFACQSASLNTSITKANIGFLFLATSDIAKSVSMFESALKDQQLLLRDAHLTLITTMEHLLVAKLLNGSKLQALQLLRRISHMQIDAFGPDDERCQMTKSKIRMLEGQDSSAQEDAAIDEAIQSLPILDGHQANKPLFNALMYRHENGSLRLQL